MQGGVTGGSGEGEGGGRLRLAPAFHSRFHFHFHLSFSGSGAYTQGLSGQGKSNSYLSVGASAAHPSAAHILREH